VLAKAGSTIEENDLVNEALAGVVANGFKIRVPIIIERSTSR